MVFFHLFPALRQSSGQAQVEPKPFDKLRTGAGAPKPLLPALCLLIGSYKDSEPTRRHAAPQQGLPLHPLLRQAQDKQWRAIPPIKLKVVWSG
ncbi:hypothetical protein A2454_04280 [Candidatus Peribacteria bacterium RIFOXYC2_FULL_55_14]|nr:MAG: hypothetical protein UY85_C0024G0011 [Candidatus Peribacteria bacterium GW2011_GWB1_54_5]KKW42575.1 MAG: hypothetical protein UY90_C0037G0005 [Candidatus Peregrinibacteria bacterium GW2011_GWA2_54_9]OGJ70930.1 MAG: hypothetical protein A2198_00800 [Candidatus Peribacteria bacterium RIFOXYA1_FULL_56_14]OGJ74225.1 MAG: hypothetical protein A2384_05835 [Candidatus Peribacteria bacterium RIFOXYB1_FULL_54_35]OGJ75241.1 MAG: hypothetical protein A2217_05965 [Candidatus Peribacteria bacterium 